MRVEERGSELAIEFWPEQLSHKGMLMRKILIMGLPGAGKTTLATALAPLLNAVVFNADAVRTNISRDLGFSHQDRIEHARRMGWMCDRVVEANVHHLGRPDQRWPLRRHKPDVRFSHSDRRFHLPDRRNSVGIWRSVHNLG